MDWALTGTTIALIIALCYLLDWLVSKEEEDKQKTAIIRWWSRLDDFSYSEAVRNSNIYCNEIFSKIYGKRHFSWRCFYISLCVSILSIFILTFVVTRIFGIAVETLEVGVVMYAAGWGVLVNGWIDYISLVETRIILRFASRAKPRNLPALLLVDLFLSIMIFISCFLAMTIAISVVQTGGDISVLDFALKPSAWYVLADWSFPKVSACFYSTFSTSVVFYVYCLSTLFFKFVKLSKTRIMIVLEKLEDSDHLFKAIGGFLAAVVVFAKAVVEICQHAFQT